MNKISRKLNYCIIIDTNDKIKFIENSIKSSEITVKRVSFNKSVSIITSGYIDKYWRLDLSKLDNQVVLLNDNILLCTNLNICSKIVDIICKKGTKVEVRYFEKNIPNVSEIVRIKIEYVDDAKVIKPIQHKKVDRSKYHVGMLLKF